MEQIEHLSMIKDQRTYIIVAGNMIPLFGFFFFEWDLIQVFMFYLVEMLFYFLLQFPKIVLFLIHQPKLVQYKRSFNYLPFFHTKSGKAIAFAFYFFINTFIFLFSLYFLTFTIYETFYDSDLKLSIIETIYLPFLKENYLIIIYIFMQYLYNFIYYHIIKKEYLYIPCEYQTREIHGRNMLLFIGAIFLSMFIYGQIYSFGGFEEDDNNLLNILLLFSLSLFKLVSDYFLILKKKKLISQYEKFKNGLRI